MADPTKPSMLPMIAVAGAVLLVLGGISAGLGAVLALVWNAAIARPFGAPTVSFWAAWGIWVLIALTLSGVRVLFDRRRAATT
jgi:hypothetical protein